MVFRRMLAALGVGGPSVDTVLTNPATRPGMALEGQVHVRGGDHAVTIEQIVLGLVTRVEVEGGDSEFHATGEIQRVVVADGFPLEPGQERSVPFSFPVPWETPITHVFGERLRGMTMGLRTELAVARAVDKGDLDPVEIHPLPAHEAVLDALARLGLSFRGADLEQGVIRGLPQTLPFYQEIEFYPNAVYGQACNEVEVSFVTSPQGVDVVIEVDKRGGLFGGGGDVFLHLRVPHTDTGTDWAEQIDAWFRSAVLSGNRSGHGPGSKSHSRGSGLAGAAAGAAFGFAGGMIAGEVVEDFFEGGGEEEE